MPDETTVVQTDESTPTVDTQETTSAETVPAKTRTYSQEEYQTAVSSQYNKALLNVMKTLGISAPDAKSIEARTSAIESWHTTNHSAAAAQVTKLQSEREELQGSLTKLQQELAMLKAGVPIAQCDSYRKMVRGFMADDEALTFENALSEVIKVRPVEIKPVNVITQSTQPVSPKPALKSWSGIL